MGAPPRASLHVPPLYAGAAVEPFLSSLDRSRTVVFVDAGLRGEVGRLGSPFARVLEVGAATVEEVARLRSLVEDPAAPVIALGGGRTLDVAKLVVRAAPAAGGPQPLATATAPLVAVPTTCGSGAEASSVAVITIGAQKRPIVGATLRPSAIAHLPDFIDLLTPAQRAAGLFDAISHLVEGSLSPLANDVHVVFAAALVPRALALLEAVESFGPQERAAALFVATMAGALQDVTSVGLVHGLAHALEPRTGLGHGVLCAAFLAPVLRWNREKSPKFDELCARAGLESEATLESFAALAARHGFARPPAPRTPDFVAALVRDPCTRTNCRLARPEDVTRLLETL